MLQHKKEARTNQKGVVFKVVKRTATFMELSWSILGLCTYTVECITDEGCKFQYYINQLTHFPSLISRSV